MTTVITSASIVKVITPVVSIIGKEISVYLKDKKIKWDSGSIAREMSRRIIDINTVKTMWSRDKGVLIEEFYYPPTVINKESKKEIDIFAKNSHQSLIIEGIVGQGKSIFLRHTCATFLSIGVIPIFLELRMVSANKSVYDLIVDYLNGCGISHSERILHHLADVGKAALVLDGFDELPVHLIQQTTLMIDQLRMKHPALKIIISSRPYQAAQYLPGFHVYALAVLASDDYDTFLKKSISDSVLRHGFTEAIAQAPDSIQGIITTPLMLTLLYMVYRNEREIPNTLPLFFDKLFNTVFTGHDRSKIGFKRRDYTGLSETKFQALFDVFCMTVMQLGGARTLDYDLFKKAFQNALIYAPESKCEVEDFRSEIIEKACLMLDEGFNETTFLHKSIVEYYAASFIKNASDETVIYFYDVAPNNYIVWETVLVFLSSIDSYRYGEFYVMREYPQHLEKLTKALKSHTKFALIEYLTQTFPNFNILVSESTTVNIMTASERHHPFIMDILETLTSTIYERISQADRKTINDAVRDTPARSTGMLSISLKSFVNHFDVTGIWIGLTSTEKTMNTVIKKYQAIIEVEKSKYKIFNLS